MISISACTETLNKGDIQYTEEEIGSIRDFLYLIAEFEINYFDNKQNYGQN